MTPSALRHGLPQTDRSGLWKATTDHAPLIASIAEGLAVVTAPSSLASRPPPTQRRYELLLSTDHYDAWLIHWPVGAGPQPHDHDGSAGAFSVVCGALDVDTVIDGVIVTRRVESGTTLWFDPDHVHALANRGGVEATSIHVYTPPLQAVSPTDAATNLSVIEHLNKDTAPGTPEETATLLKPTAPEKSTHARGVRGAVHDDRGC